MRDSKYECSCSDCVSCVENGMCCAECHDSLGLEGPATVALSDCEIPEENVHPLVEMLDELHADLDTLLQD